jgi:hypothetical protein
MPFVIREQVGIDIKKYILSVTGGPAICILPFALCLITARYFYANNLLKGLLSGGSIGGLILAIIYYRYVIPDKVKSFIFKLKR